MDKLTAFTSEQLKETVPAFEIGDTVKVYNKIIEGTRERIQIFEGTVCLLYTSFRKRSGEFR